MSFRINRGIFQFKDNASDTFINKFKIDDRGEMIEVDPDGNKVAAYMRLGDKATDSDKVDGYHATNAGGGIPVLNSNAYWYAPSWIHLNEGRGLFSGHNGAHLLPNNQGAYGAWRMIGTRGGWEGLHFGGSNGVTLMMNETESGLHRNGVGWKFRHQNGKFYVYTGTNGGGTGYPVWHEGTISTSEVAALKTSLGVTGLPYSCDIFVEGDPDLYYPVHFMGGDQDVWRRIIIKRGYGETAPWDPIGTGAHRGGLLLDWEGNFGGWGGAQYSDRLRVFNESYTTICASMYRTTHSMGYTFFLRGGGAVYHIYSDQAINGRGQSGAPDIAYDTDFLFYNGGSNTSYNVYAPAPMDRQDAARISELRTLKRSELDAIYQPTGSYLTTSGKAADSDKLDGINSTSFLRSDADDTMSGNLTLKYNTANASAYNAINFAPYDDAAGVNDYIIKAESSRGVFGRKSFGWHVHSNSAFGVYSNGWEKLFGVEGQTGNAFAKGTFNAGQLTVSGSTNSGRLYSDSWGMKIGTSSGHIQFGPANNDWAHIYTDRPAFYFNKALYENGARLATQSYASSSADAVREDLTPLISTAQTTADNAATAAAAAQATANTAETRANGAREEAVIAGEAARAAQTTADSKLGATAKAADSNLLDGLDSSRFLYTTTGQFSGDWNTLTDSNQEIRLVEVHNITGGAHSNHPTGLYTYGSVLGWQLDNATFKLYSSHTGDLAFQTGWNNDGYSGWRTIWHSANFNPATKADTSHNHSTLYAGHGYINSGDWNTYSSPHGSDSTFGGGIYRVESSAANPPASGVYNWSLYQQGNTSRGSQIAVGAYAGGNRLYFRGSNQNANAYRNWAEVWHTDNFDPATKEEAGAADAVRTDLSGLISTATSKADTASSTASTANTTANSALAAAATAQDTADEATTLARAAQTTADGKLGATAKAADSNLLDGIDSSAFIRENQDRRHKVIRFTGEGGDSGNGDYNYAIYQAGGAWSHPYPDLVIAYHTGIKIGGYKNYGGVKIYNDAPERSGAQQVASFGDGDANVRVSNNLHIGSAGGWITDLLNTKETAGAADAAKEELVPLISNAQTTADNAATAAAAAQATANTAETRANDAKGAAAAAQATADGKLGATAKATNSHAADGINIVGYGTNEFSFYQAAGAFAGYSGWANYFIGNHGSGSSYYNTTHIMPFWGPPQYSRLEGGTFRGPYTYWTTENFDPAAKANVSHDHNDLYYTKAQSNSNYDSAGSASTAQTNAINAANDRFDNEVMPQVTTNATNIARNATDIASKLGTTGKAADADKLDGYDWMQSGKSVRADEFYTSGWLRNYNSNTGLYNQATGQHWYSDDDDFWNVAGGTAANGIRFRDEHNGTIRGYVYADYNNNVGLLDAGGSWAIKHLNDNGTYFYTDNETLEFRVGRDVVSGGYGTVQTDTTRSGWGGYSIAGRVVFMHDHSNGWGIYNDVNDEWMIYGTLNGQVELRHNSAVKLATNSGGVTVTGTVSATAFSGSLDWSNVTNKPVIPAATEPVQVTVDRGENSTLSSIFFSPAEGVATFTLADGQTFRLAFAR